MNLFIDLSGFLDNLPQIETDSFKAGFDKTDMSNVHFRGLLEMIGATVEAEHITDDKSFSKGFKWQGNGGYVMTSNNPITGFYHFPIGLNSKEHDWLGYVGIEGTPLFVYAVVGYIETHAEYVKNREIGKRSYI